MVAKLKDTIIALLFTKLFPSSNAFFLYNNIKKGSINNLGT